MSQSPSTPEAETPIDVPTASVDSAPTPPVNPEPPPSYVKLAMRNMVRKRKTSLFHFVLTTVGLLSVLVGLAYLTR